MQPLHFCLPQNHNLNYQQNSTEIEYKLNEWQNFCSVYLIINTTHYSIASRSTTASTLWNSIPMSNRNASFVPAPAWSLPILSAELPALFQNRVMLESLLVSEGRFVERGWIGCCADKISWKKFSSSTRKVFGFRSENMSSNLPYVRQLCLLNGLYKRYVSRALMEFRTLFFRYKQLFPTFGSAAIMELAENAKSQHWARKCTENNNSWICMA